MLAFLVVPLSNDASERTFSIKKTETNFRSEIAQDTTCALFSVKINTDVRPAAFVPDAKVLAAARKTVFFYSQEYRGLDGK